MPRLFISCAGLSLLVHCGAETVAASCDFERLDGSALTVNGFRSKFREASPGHPVVLTGLNLGAGLNVSAIKTKKFTKERVESQHAVVYRAKEVGRKTAITALGAPTKLGKILDEKGPTLYLLKEQLPSVKALESELVVPKFLKPIQMNGPTVSVGGRDASSPFHQHPENWFAQIHGKKAWVVGPGDDSAVASAVQGAQPCKMRERQKLPKGVQHCVLDEGEVLYLPDQWWHGTCNTANFVLGIGFIGPLDHLPELHLQAALGDVKKVTDLADSRGALGSPDNQGRRPLHWAANKGHIEVVKRLLDMQADAQDTEGNGACPMHLAAFEGHLAVVKALAQAMPKGPSGVSPRTEAQARPIHLASSRGHADVVKFLLKQGSHAAPRDSKGAEPLHMAAYEGHTAVAALLLANGAEANAVTKDGKTTPSKLAYGRGHDEMIKKLEKHREL